MSFAKRSRPQTSLTSFVAAMLVMSLPAFMWQIEPLRQPRAKVEKVERIDAERRVVVAMDLR